MEEGKNYLVGIAPAPTIEIKEGSWANIRYQNGRTVQVSPTLATESVGNWVVHIYALKKGPDPALGQDELVYRDKNGIGESRTITSFYLLDK
jgi:hypothetical protein